MSDRISEPEHYDEIRTDSDRNFWIYLLKSIKYNQIKQIIEL